MNEIRNFYNADMVLKNARIVNVLSDEVKRCDIAISNGVIIGIGDCLKGKNELQLNGKFVCPGFIDTHSNPCASLVDILSFDSEVTKLGTTCYVMDLSDIINSKGIKALNTVLELRRSLKANVLFCFPLTAEILTEFDFASFNEKIIFKIQDLNEYINILNDPILSNKFSSIPNKFIEMDITDTLNFDLDKGLINGVGAINGCTSFFDAQNIIRLGGTVTIKESSYTKSTINIVRGIVQNMFPINRFTFCTHRKNIMDIRTNGHINLNIKRAIYSGLNPVYAMKIATVNASEIYRLYNLGSISIGKQADMVILNDLTSVDIDSVYIRGEKLSDNKNIKVKSTIKKHTQINKKLSFDLSERNGNIFSVKILNNGITTFYSEKPATDIDYMIKNNRANIISVSNSNYSNIFSALIEGFEISNGAVAVNISSQNTNSIIIGDNKHDMLIATTILQNIARGIVIVTDGQVVFEYNLMCSDNVDETVLKLEDCIKILHDMGVNASLNILALFEYISASRYPKIRVTPYGLFDPFLNKYI